MGDAAGNDAGDTPERKTDFRFRSLRSTYIKEWGVKSLLWVCATLSIFTTFAIVAVLFTEATRFFQHDNVYCDAVIAADGDRVCNAFVGTSTRETAGTEQACPDCGHMHSMPAEITLVNFLTGTKWNPLLGRESEKAFGVWALISATLMVSGIAMCVALPLGLITAIYLSEYASPRVRATIKPTLEVLAGIPTVVYGFFALTVITPTLQFFHGGFGTFNAMAGAVSYTHLTLPTICSV